MQRGIALAIAVLVCGFFCFYCIHTHAPMIQGELLNEVKKVLAGNQISGQGVSVDGRDVLLTGTAGSAAIGDSAQKLAAEVYGVRTVSVRTVDLAPDARTSATRAETQSRMDALLAQDVVEFRPASAQLTTHGREVLDRVAPLLAAAPDTLCEIQGHTDAQGNPKANLSLSYRRAIETKNYLVNKGIAPERLTAKAYGDTQPIATNETAAGRRQNRRINFLLKEKL